MIVDVLPGMTLAQVIMRLREAHGDSVTIRISPDSALLLTANEFRALSLAAEREQIAIAVETRDGLRRQLATLFGVPLAIPTDEDEEDEPQPIDGPANTLPTADPEEPDDAGTTTTTAAPVRTGRNGASGGKRGNGRMGRVVAALAGIALLLLLVIGGYWYFLRTADVRLTTVTQPVNTTIAFSVARPGQDVSAAGAVPAEQVSFELSVKLDAPATGIESIGTILATGTLELRNPGSQAITIPAGTIIDTWEGDQFVTSDEVTVPPSENGSAGEGTVVVAAATPGAFANRDPGMLSGQMENGIYFSNRGTPIAGGGDETTTVVTQDDLDALQARAEETLRSLAATSSLSDNRRVVPSTLTIQQFTTSYSSEVGDEADAVSVDATIAFDALAFPTDALDAGAERALADQVPAGYQLVEGSVTYEVPVESGETGGVIAMLVQVTGSASVVVTDEEREQLADLIAGESKEAAESRLSRDPRFDSVSIDVSPGWMPQQLPSSTGKIDITIE
ncbi:MAG: hypothetical protein KF883_16010 [Thermomicrobiales bacterium]|nr:hypothetical protein [Thermomicrobiales bacterium]